MEFWRDFANYEGAIAFAQSKQTRVTIRFNPESGRYDCLWQNEKERAA